MKDDSDPSHSQEFAGMPLWERSFWLSRAFVEASQCLCSGMLEGEFSSQYSSSRVILHLARHGTELFLKGAISAATGRPPEPGHNLNRLFAQYRRVYPDMRFNFHMPSHFNVDPNRDLFEDNEVDPEYFHATLDQRHRYPADRAGKDFAAPEVFDPTATLNEIQELSRSLMVLEFSEIKPYLKSRNSL